MLETQNQILLKKARTTLSNHRRKAKELGAVLDYGRTELLHLLVLNQHCFYCGCPLGWDLQIDHAEPLAWGPRACRLANLRVACKGCNAQKGQLSESEFHRLLDFIEGLDPRSQEDIRIRLKKWKGSR